MHSTRITAIDLSKRIDADDAISSILSKALNLRYLEIDSWNLTNCINSSLFDALAEMPFGSSLEAFTVRLKVIDVVKCLLDPLQRKWSHRFADNSKLKTLHCTVHCPQGEKSISVDATNGKSNATENHGDE